MASSTTSTNSASGKLSGTDSDFLFITEKMHINYDRKLFILAAEESDNNSTIIINQEANGGGEMKAGGIFSVDYHKNYYNKLI